MEKIKIVNKLIGDNEPIFVIAEACDNHMGNMTWAKEMVDFAKMCGADAIKFQHHLPDEEMLPNSPMSDNFEEPLYEFLKKYALTLAQHKELKKYCDKVGIIYLCTPFSKKAADEISSLVSAFKIGSGELTDIPSLKEIAKHNKPMIISTGMSTIKEIEETVSAILPINKQIILMNCTSEYPPSYKDINLRVIPQLKEKFNLIVGHSDHTPDNYTCFAAVTLGAKLIEKHIILDKSIPGPDQKVSIEPLQLYDLVSGIRKIEKAMGSIKSLNKLEKPIQLWARRSIVAIRDIKKGETFSLDNLWSKRPGIGVPSKELPKFIGKMAKRDIKKNEILKQEDCEL